MSLISNDVASSGIWRASIISEVSQGIFKVYIPALHSSNIPFVVNGEQVTTQIREVVTDSEGKKCYQGILLGPDDYPSANSCVWQTRTTLQAGDSVWIMFENGDINYPVVVGQLGSTISSSVNFGAGTIPNSGGGLESGYLTGYGDFVDVPSDFSQVQTYEKEYRLKSQDAYPSLAEYSKRKRTNGWPPSPQATLRENAINDNRQRRGDIFGLTNCAIIDDRLEIATLQNIGGKLSISIGDYLDVEFDDGTVWNCISADIKSTGDSNITAWGHQHGNNISIVEIIYWDYVTNSGNQSKKVKRITKVGSYTDGIVNPLEGNDMQKKVATFASTYTGDPLSVSSQPLYCQAWVRDVYRICTGIDGGPTGDASTAGRKYQKGDVLENGANVPLGAAIYEIQSGGKPGHVEIYIGNGRVASNLIMNSNNRFNAVSGHWTNNNSKDPNNKMKKPSIETVEEYRAWASRAASFEAFKWGWPGDIDLTKLK